MLKMIISRVLILSMLITLMFSNSTVQAATMSTWTASSYENIFQEAVKPTGASTAINLVMVKNEYESAQILMRSDSNFTINNVTFSNLVSGSNILTSNNLKYNFVEYVYMGEHTIINDPVSPDFIEPPTGAAGYYPDALSNTLTNYSVLANKTQPIWVTAYVPKTTTSGTYTGTVTVDTSLGKYTVNISVEVNNVTIPDTKNAQFDSVFWTNIDASSLFYDDDTHPNDNTTPIYGHQRWSADWWTLVGNMADNMKEHRMNVLFVHPVQLLRDGGTTIDASGNYVFNWSKFDEYIQFHLDKGYVKKIQSFPLLATVSLTELYAGYIKKNASGKYYVDVFPYWVKDANGKDTNTISPEALKWYSQYLPALQTHLQQKGWTDMWQQLIGDEANTETQFKTYNDMIAKFNQYCPQLKSADSMNWINSVDYHLSLNPTIDVQIPLTTEYQRSEDRFIQQKALGREVYTYVCNWPQGPWLNRFIDKAVWQMRTIGWLSYKWNNTGFLHWAWQHWTDQTRHYLIGVDDEEYKGDHYTVWPDTANNTIKSSIRNAAWRDAAEDYEIFYILGQSKPGYAKDIAGSIAQDANNLYNGSISDMIAKRAELVRAAAGAVNPKKSLSFWNFSDVRGTHVIDNWNGNNLTLRNASSWTSAGESGKGLYFDGSTNGGADINKADLTGAWTVSMAVKRQNSPNVTVPLLSSQQYGIKLEQWSPNNSDPDWLGISKHTATEDYDWKFNYKAPENLWVMLTFVCNGTDTKLYVNGEFKDQINQAIPCPMQSVGYRKDYLSAGNNVDFMKGWLDEIKIYDKALSADEVRALNSDHIGIANWKFDEGSGISLWDSWCNNNVMLSGLVSSGADATWTTDRKGQAGKALYLDGKTAGVTIGKPDLAGNWSAAMWVLRKPSTYTTVPLLSSKDYAIKLEQWPSTGKVGVSWQDRNNFAFDYSVPFNTWTHLTFVGTTAGVSLYVNGKPLQWSDSVKWMSCPMDSLGYRKDYLSKGNNVDYMTGGIDDVKIFDRVLTDAEILDIYNQ